MPDSYGSGQIIKIYKTSREWVFAVKNKWTLTKRNEFKKSKTLGWFTEEKLQVIGQHWIDISYQQK